MEGDTGTLRDKPLPKEPLMLVEIIFLMQQRNRKKLKPTGCGGGGGGGGGGGCVYFCKIGRLPIMNSAYNLLKTTNNTAT